MDWLSLQDRMPRDGRLSARGARLHALEAVLDGRLYDGLTHPFSRERTEAGEYIPLDERRPSVRTGLCRVVVEDSVSLLFSEGHWPSIRGDDPRTCAVLGRMVDACRLNEVMLDAATRGSVGSVAILLRVLRSKPFFEVKGTKYLTPVWRHDDPDELRCVTECYTVSGAELVGQGFAVDASGGPYWFKRVWDEQHESWFVPVPVSADPASMQRDEERSVRHGLGFVPIVWVRNISGNSGHDTEGPDGTCTFAASIDTVIEIDYLLSQAGRGLKYGSDPTLVLKDPQAGFGGNALSRIGGAAAALTLPPEGDAKLLEINGNAAAAVLAHVKELRAIALEAIHGNRAHGDRAGNAPSGRAIELMCQGLIWLSDRLRISYGEGGLLPLLRMVCRAATTLRGGLIIGGVQERALDPAGLSLSWPSWFPETASDRQTQASGVVTLMQAGVIDSDLAYRIVAPFYGLPDAPDVSAATDVGTTPTG